MDANTLLGQLEEVARSLGMQVRYEKIKREGTFYPGGLCRLKGEYVVIVNSTASAEDRAQTLAKALNRFDLSQVYLRPGLRDYLDKIPQQEELVLEEK